ncbi:bifunctional metallophosphatase/5'-nucleotidase [Kallotenue papyrolyticum]|uniref:bifunctional metallophosphatase/5'-nucleotidase n=1 Tax=Kallotenue papyrolyticum TaxID=1325125 RepID=UPI00049286CB|nr:5'-nucleotidase C-terminal domain-containing protein [Kallotenue papyrolyticum]
MESKQGYGRRAQALICLLALVCLLAGAPVALAQDGPAYVLRVLHTNDHHARIEPAMVGDKPFGGVARRKTLIDRLRAEGGNQLLLDAGDVFQGTLYFNQYKGQADLFFYNAMGYDAMAIGNHEFDAGQQPLADFIAGATFPVLSANISVAATSPLAGKIRPWVIKEVGGERIGIFGLTTEETAILSNPGPGVTFTSPVEAARRAVAELQGQGINKIIALTHVGLPVDQSLARQVAGIDLIVGGHSHTPLDGQPGAVGPYPLLEKAPDGTNVVIVTDWEWGKWLGDIRVGFDAEGRVTNWQGQPIPVDESIPPDPAFEAKVREYAVPLEQLKATPVGEAAVPLNGNRADVRSKETNLGNLIADAMLDKTRPDGGQVAIMNGGGIRASIDAGPVTLGEVLEVLPFGNTIARVDLTGAQLRQALENGVSQVEQGAGRFPQVAGMRFTYNPAAPAGNRVVSVEILQNGSYVPLDPNATYRVITNNFMLGGGDGYAVFTQGANKLDTGFILADVVADYIRARSPVNPQVEGRIQTATAGAPAPQPSPSPAPSPAPAPQPGASPAPQPPAGGRPVTLPDTGMPVLPLGLLAGMGVAAIAGGLALRREWR